MRPDELRRLACLIEDNALPADARKSWAFTLRNWAELIEEEDKRLKENARLAYALRRQP